MKELFAVSIATLSALESILLAWLFIALFVSPGGSGEFTGIHRFSSAMLVLFFLPPPAFATVFALVMKFYKEENHKTLRSLIWALIASLLTVPLVLVFTRGIPPGPPWHLIVNAIVLAVWIAAIAWQTLTRDRGGSFRASA